MGTRNEGEVDVDDDDDGSMGSWGSLALLMAWGYGMLMLFRADMGEVACCCWLGSSGE